MILKLSELLRYQLYETGKERVFLDSEITFIKNYLELEKERAANIDLTFTVCGNTMQYIAPMVFMPIIKLALTNRKAGKKLKINIENNTNVILFSCNCLGSIDSNELTSATKGIKLAYGDKAHYVFDNKGEINIHIAHE